MSMNFRSQNTLLAAKVESSIGTDATPSVSSDAIRAEPAEYRPEFESEQTNFARASISQSAPITSGGRASMAIKTALMGSGAAGTTAPDIGTLLRGCAMSQTALAADVTGTAQAGASGTITLAAGASAVNNFYRGLVIETTSGTGSGQRRVISSYVGSTKVASVFPNWSVNPDATTQYAIRKSHLYQPITVGQESLTLYSYLRNSASGGLANLRKVTGAMGGWNISVMPKKIPRLNATFQGLFPAAPTDVSDPGTGTFQTSDPKPYVSAQTWLGQVACKFNAFTLDSGNKPSNFDDPAQAYGNDTTEIVDRVGTGRITVAKSMVATQDAISDWINSVSKPLWLCHGAVGNGISIFIPALRATGHETADSDGFVVDNIPFQTTGDDLEVLLNFF